jgi:hypothetical protein
MKEFSIPVQEIPAEHYFQKPELHRDTFAGLNAHRFSENLLRFTKSDIAHLHYAYGLRWKKDTSRVKEFIFETDIPQEKQQELLTSLQQRDKNDEEAQRMLLEKTVLGIDAEVKQTSAKMRAATLAVMLEIAGCSLHGGFVKPHNFEVDRQESSAEKKFLLEAVEVARKSDLEHKYIYTIGSNGEARFMKKNNQIEPCVIGTRFDANGASPQCVEFIHGIKKDSPSHRMVHLHTHPLQSAIDINQHSVLDTEHHLLNTDAEKIQKHEVFGGAFPPSLMDVLGLGNANNTIFESGNDEILETRVADAFGVWTYSISPENPIIKDSIKLQKEIDAIIQAHHLSDSDKEYLLAKINPNSQPSIMPASEEAEKVFQEIVNKQDQLSETILSHQENRNFIQEYETKQLELVSQCFKTREDFLNAIDEFIEYAKDHGIFLKYEILL